jgi:hypothetical protein
VTPAGAPPPAPADERMTADRQERKFVVGEAATAALVMALSRRLAPHRFRGEGASPIPAAQQFATTVYFDTPSRAHHRALRAGEAAGEVKLRAREYYDLHPGLVELATDPQQIVRYQPWLWFELKLREGARTRKHRFRLNKREVPVVLDGGYLSPEDLARAGGVAAVDVHHPVAHIVRHCRDLGEPLLADCLVNYRRLPWQDATGALRVTVDLDLAVFAPPPDLWTRRRALVRDTLGPPRLVQPDAVVEVKTLGPPPPWISELLATAGARPAPSGKFALASEAVRGPVPQPRASAGSRNAR